MSSILLVVDNPSRWQFNIEGVQLVAAREYLVDPQFSNLRGCRVFNLCRSYRYQSLGYYVSLLAEARGHKPVPTVSTVQDLRYQSLIKVVSNDLDELIQKSLATLQSSEFTLSIYFARNLAKRYDRLSRQLFNLFPVPLLRANFRKTGNDWTLTNISPIASNEIPEDHRPFVIDFAKDYFNRGRAPGPKRKPARFFMAILADPEEATPPSNERALRKFAAAAADLSISVETIGKEDYGRLGEFDALFIRQTTAVNNPTYRFARRAEAEGLVVIDDPTSIVRCTNKVYLAELLSRHKIPAPRTEIIHKDNLHEILDRFSLPFVIKQPDSSFSLGVVKVSSREEYLECVERLMEKSEMLIAQEFLKTDFDWRIGILNRKPIYACRYFMARGHWQIYNNALEDKNSDLFSGDFETLPVELAPTAVVRTALKAANLIGDSLYGVDLKQIHRQCFVIEVNDNPSIDSGVEDKILKDTLYERVMEVFLQRLESNPERRSGR